MGDAQKELDERNGHFDILDFFGMKSNKSKVKCKEKGHIFNVSIDSLLRNKNDKYFGCPYCNKKRSTYTELKADLTENETIEDLKKYPRLKNYGYIYRFVNLINKKVYIGKTIYPVERYRTHLQTAFEENDKCYNYPLYSAIRKYGIENFSFSVILELVPLNKIFMVEQEYMHIYNSLTNVGWGYNQTEDMEPFLKEEKFEAVSIKIKDIIEKASTGQNQRRDGKPVALLNEKGEIQEVFLSTHDCAERLFGDRKQFSSVARVCRGEAKKGRYLGKKLIYLQDYKRGDV